MRKFQCSLFVLKRSYTCYYIIFATVPLILGLVYTSKHKSARCLVKRKVFWRINLSTVDNVSCTFNKLDFSKSIASLAGVSTLFVNWKFGSLIDWLYSSVWMCEIWLLKKNRTTNFIPFVTAEYKNLPKISLVSRMLAVFNIFNWFSSESKIDSKIYYFCLFDRLWDTSFIFSKFLHKWVSFHFSAITYLQKQQKVLLSFLCRHKTYFDIKQLTYWLMSFLRELIVDVITPFNFLRSLLSLSMWLFPVSLFSVSMLFTFTSLGLRLLVEFSWLL